MTRAVFFYGTDFSVFDLPLPRYLNEDWALIHEESPKNNPLISQYNIIRMFNHTATFKSQSDLPLTLQYLESLEVITDEVGILILLSFGKYSMKTLISRNFCNKIVCEREIL